MASRVRSEMLASVGTEQGAVADPAPIALLTLDVPEKRNALSPELCQELCAALPQAAERGARAAVLTGTGETFCAGFDLDAFPEKEDPLWVMDNGPLGATMRTVSLGPLPVVVALNGAAIGAGCELALSGDLCVAHPGVILQMPPVRLGLIYTPQGILRLIASCGLARARQFLLTAEPLRAEEAERWGLVHRVAPAADLLDTAVQLARKLAAQPKLAMLGTRLMLERLLHEGPQLAPDSARELLELRVRAYASDESRAARAAFRRRPRRG